jgi:hypothetical protein
VLLLDIPFIEPRASEWERKTRRGGDPPKQGEEPNTTDGLAAGEDIKSNQNL